MSASMELVHSSDVGGERRDVLAKRDASITITIIAARPPVLILKDDPEPEAPASVSMPFVVLPGSDP